jgi:hypothetical protein
MKLVHLPLRAILPKLVALPAGLAGVCPRSAGTVSVDERCLLMRLNGAPVATVLVVDSLAAQELTTLSHRADTSPSFELVGVVP